MIILDTNVFSAISKPADNPLVAPWLDRIDRTLIAVTTPTIFEVRYGLELMPVGRKRSILAAAFEIVMAELSATAGRILAVDADAAECAGRIAAARKQRGVNIDLPDTLIGAIAMTRGLPLATRNTRHFDDLPVALVNPWHQV